MILRYWQRGSSSSGGGGGGSLTVELNKYEIEEYDGSPPATVSDSCTATPSGGTAPYTYAWVKVPGSGNSTGVSVTNDTTATVGFEFSSGISATRSFVYRVTVTDTDGTTITADVSVYFQIGGSPP